MTREKLDNFYSNTHHHERTMQELFIPFYQRFLVAKLTLQNVCQY